MAQTRLQAVREEDVEEAETESPRRKLDPALTALLLTGLRTLTQRTVVALASLVDGAMIASVFVLWLMIIQNPTPLQLIASGMYAVFILLCVIYRRKAQPQRVKGSDSTAMAT